MSGVLDSLEEHRAVREELERAVLPLATSVDGRRFTFQTSLHELELEPGGYVAIEGAGATRLGQLLSLELRHQDTTAPGVGQIRVRGGGGEGVVLHGDDRPFHDAGVRPATADEVGAWLDRTRPKGAQLDVGQLALARGVPFQLNAGGFGRHTFVCGQSGSGKTYSLGVLLERLLMETTCAWSCSTPTRTTCASGSRVWTTRATATPRRRCRCGAARTVRALYASASATSAPPTRPACCASTHSATVPSTASSSPWWRTSRSAASRIWPSRRQRT